MHPLHADRRRPWQVNRDAISWYLVGFLTGLICCGLTRFLWPAFFLSE